MLAKELAYYRAHFREAVQKDGVICLECGRRFKSLAQHVKKHTLGIHDYKAKWGYNRTTALVALSTHKKLSRAALALNLLAFSPRDSVQKATKAIKGRSWPYRPETRLKQTEAARARLAASFRLAKLKRNSKSHRQVPRSAPITASRFKPDKDDLKVLSLRRKGL